MKFFPLTLTLLTLALTFTVRASTDFGLDLSTPETIPNHLTELQRQWANERFRNFSDSALAAFSGADIVGNGGGYIEQNFKYVYQGLDRTISQCLSVPFCAGTKEDQEILRAIRDIILEHRDDKNRVVFLKDTDFDHFFNTELDPGERIAKTGFSPEFPIFINLSLVEEMKIGKDLSLILGILAHEIGHQVGISSHAYLDSLASKLRSVFYENTLTIEMDQVSLPMKFMVFKARQNFAHDETLLSAEGQLVRMPRLALQYLCARKADLIGTTISNPHWNSPVYRAGELHVSVEAWGDFSCSSSDGSFFVEKKTVTFTVVFDRKLNSQGKLEFTQKRASVTTR